ncbi:putative hydrolase [Lachnellula suecica]|uniref:Putative hydrolase n=1 Tax=Lachnellula suecica TaxID=602035 RepID=A0A8T9CCX7_9HELO|nr:putative hydrolase [Lachnellula suecica]
MKEKGDLKFADRAQKWRLEVQWQWKILFVPAVLLVWLWTFSSDRRVRTQNSGGGAGEKEFEWSDVSGPISNLMNQKAEYAQITPSKKLQYTPCFPPFHCARLQVPLNWNISNLSTGALAAIAIVKLPASVPVTDTRYGGVIIMNPAGAGGPGESGVHLMLTGGKYIQKILDSPDGKSFDILSFDPRGVNNTTPKLRCFPDAFLQQAWVLQYPDYGLLWDADSVVGLEWARAQALGASCEENGGGEGVLGYASSA